LHWDAERKRLVEKLQSLDLPVLVLLIRKSGDKTEPDAGPLADDPERFIVLDIGQIEQQLARLG
jgi:hypothetical protein